MDSVKRYFDFLAEKLSDAAASQSNTIREIAELIVNAINQGGRFYVFGSGHSHMIAEELFTRAGGLVFVEAILLPELMLHQFPGKSTNIERLSGYAKAILDLYPIKENDVLLVVSNSGRNNVPIEMCLEAQKRGAKVIALTSMKHSSQVSSRHLGGKNLYQLADYVLDNQAELGDASFEIEGAPAHVAGISDFIGIALVQALVVAISESMIKQGLTPPIIKSANVDGSSEYNKKIKDEFKKRHLK